MSMSENFVHCRRGLNGVSLHDCHVTRIDRRGDLVELTLPRGVWLLPGCPDNPGEMICKTRAAILRIPVAELPRALAVRPMKRHAKPPRRQSLRPLESRAELKPLPWNRLRRRVNAEGWTLEFLSCSVRGAFAQMECWLWRPGLDPACECFFTISRDSIEVLWSEINPEIRG